MLVKTTGEEICVSVSVTIQYVEKNGVGVNFDSGRSSFTSVIR